jgi:hypothetical protein
MKMEFVEESPVPAPSASPDKVGVLYNNCYGILYNTCYGGFSLSKKVIDLYNERSPQRKLTHSHSFIPRHDPLLIEIFNEIGSEGFSERCVSDIRVRYIDSKYKDFYDITEYDGMEQVEILYDSYYLKRIKDITFDESITNDEKHEKILEVFKEINPHN